MSNVACISKKDCANFNNTELVLLCQQGNEAALSELLMRHKGYIISRFCKMAPDWSDHSDLIQEVNIRVWRFIGQLRKPASFKTWLSQLILNVFYDELRKRPRDFHVVSLDEPVSFDGSEEAPREIKDSSRQPEDALLAAELTVVLNEAMNELPLQFKRAQVLRDIDGLSYEEIAKITQTELGTVKSRIARARLRIQNKIADYVKEAA
jgi:RNA polymerase sigma-70 factor (ECF subfamily)